MDSNSGMQWPSLQKQTDLSTSTSLNGEDVFVCLFIFFPAGLELCLPSAEIKDAYTPPILAFQIKCFKKTAMIITLRINIHYTPLKLMMEKI